MVYGDNNVPHFTCGEGKLALYIKKPRDVTACPENLCLLLIPSRKRENCNSWFCSIFSTFAELLFLEGTLSTWP